MDEKMSLAISHKIASTIAAFLLLIYRRKQNSLDKLHLMAYRYCFLLKE